MSKVIGIVSEGPTDYLVLKTVIDKITGTENKYLSLQPEADLLGKFGNGWKGVWRWCKETEHLDLLMDGIQPNIDLIVIQMDGDVIRKEKEVHCMCDSTMCTEKGKQFPLYCEAAKEGCPVAIPCPNHQYQVSDSIQHGSSVLCTALEEDNKRVIITIPCDSTDAWIVAAYDDIENAENIEDPWKSVIAKGKYYHDIRVRGDKKNTVTYARFMDTLADKWNVVTERCLSAKVFEQDFIGAYNYQEMVANLATKYDCRTTEKNPAQEQK